MYHVQLYSNLRVGWLKSGDKFAYILNPYNFVGYYGTPANVEFANMIINEISKRFRSNPSDLQSLIEANKYVIEVELTVYGENGSYPDSVPETPSDVENHMYLAELYPQYVVGWVKESNRIGYILNPYQFQGFYGNVEGHACARKVLSYLGRTYPFESVEEETLQKLHNDIQQNLNKILNL